MKRQPKEVSRAAAFPLRGDFASRPEWRRALREHRRGSVKPHYAFRDSASQVDALTRVVELHNNRVRAEIVTALIRGGVPPNEVAALADQECSVSGAMLDPVAVIRRCQRRVLRYYGLQNKYHPARLKVS